MSRISSIKAVLFDFDGTLTKPGALDFSIIKKEVGCPLDQPVLEYIFSLPEPGQRTAMGKLDRFEYEAAALSTPNEGAEEIIDFIRAKGLGVAVISRNSLKCIQRALDNFTSIGLQDFDFIISRDDAVKPKPSGDGILLAAKKFGVSCRELLMVGDFIFDIQAGRQADAVTVYLDSGLTALPDDLSSHYTIAHLSELKLILRMRLPLSTGKLPNDLLSPLLNQLTINDPSVLIPPGVGDDTAAVDISANDTLVLKTDPITFATDSIGHYAVLVNANDIATSGAVPRWFLMTLLFPPGSCAKEIHQVVHELHMNCRRWGITLCGGHTEISDAVTRAVVCGSLVGTVSRKHLIDKKQIQPGDRILFTKAVSVEGTSIIAREFPEKLQKLRVSEAVIEKCKGFLSEISVLAEAQVAAQSGAVSAMHDVTEGGLATALEELSIAGQHQIKVDLDQIPIFPETMEICELLRLNPLGLIGSGSLLICCRRQACESLIQAIEQEGISVTCIGEVSEPGDGIMAFEDGMPITWPRFEVDEITKLFS